MTAFLKTTVWRGKSLYLTTLDLFDFCFVEPESWMSTILWLSWRLQQGYTQCVHIANTMDIRKHSVLSPILCWWFTNIYVGNFQAIYICLIKQYRKWVFSIRTLKGPPAPAPAIINAVDYLSCWKWRWNLHTDDVLQPTLILYCQ